VRDAEVQRAANGADRLGIAPCPDVVVTGHGHGAEPYAGNFKSADRDVLHGDVLLSALSRCVSVAGPPRNGLPDLASLLPKATFLCRNENEQRARVLDFQSSIGTQAEPLCPGIQ